MGSGGWTWLLGTIALVYNPVLTVHLTREIWSVVNIATVVVAVVSVFALRPKSIREISHVTSGNEILP